MPPPSIDRADRPERVRQLRSAIGTTQLSLRALAAALAQAGHGNANNLRVNLQRWTAYEPRPRCVDAAPDWIFEAIKNLNP